MSKSRHHQTNDPDWVRNGVGARPSLAWTFVTEAPITALDLARESGETFVADDTGVLCRLDRRGKRATLTRLSEPARVISWSDDGQFGSALCGDSTVYFFDRKFESLWKLNVPEVVLTVAISPFGSHLFIGCADGRNRIYDASKKKIAQFETIRPVAFAQFVAAAPELVVSAEHGMICRYDVNGQQIWQSKLWSNVGQLSVTGDGEAIFLACFVHGIQTLDGSGNSLGSYVLDGTVHCAHASFDRHRIIAATVEGSLYWLDIDGELLWSTQPPDAIAAVRCDPLGEWMIGGLVHGRVFKLDWSDLGNAD